MSFKMFAENDLPHELLLTTSQKTKLRNAFKDNMSTDLKLSKAQVSKMIQSGAISLAKNVSAPLVITAAASVVDAGSQKKIHGTGTATLIISNVEINDMIKNVQALEYSNMLLKGVSKTFKN